MCLSVGWRSLRPRQSRQSGNKSRSSETRLRYSKRGGENHSQARATIRACVEGIREKTSDAKLRTRIDELIVVTRVATD